MPAFATSAVQSPSGDQRSHTLRTQARLARQTLRAMALSDVDASACRWSDAATALVEGRPSQIPGGAPPWRETSDVEGRGANKAGWREDPTPRSVALERAKFWLGLPSDYYSSGE